MILKFSKEKFERIKRKFKTRASNIFPFSVRIRYVTKMEITIFGRTIDIKFNRALFQNVNKILLQVFVWESQSSISSVIGVALIRAPVRLSVEVRFFVSTSFTINVRFMNLCFRMEPVQG